MENFILELLFIMFVDQNLYKTYILNIRVVNRFSLKTAKRACWWNIQIYFFDFWFLVRLVEYNSARSNWYWHCPSPFLHDRRSSLRILWCFWEWPDQCSRWWCKTKHFYFYYYQMYCWFCSISKYFILFVSVDNIFFFLCRWWS